MGFELFPLWRKQRLAVSLAQQPEPLEVLNRRVLRGEEIDRVTLLNSVEGLFRV